MSLRLEAIEGPTRSTHAVTGITVIGRDPQSGIVLPVQTVSREHAIVRPDDAGPGYVIEDLDSRGGTYVNGVRTRRAVLLEGDRIQIGPAVFLVHLREDALAGSVDPATVEEEPAPLPKAQTLRLTVDAVRFRLRAADLEGKDPAATTGPAPPPTPATTLATSLGSAPAVPSLGAALASAQSLAPKPSPQDRLETIIELSNALASTHDQARLTREVARRLLSLFPQARRVGIFDVEGEGDRPTIVPRLLVDREAARTGQPKSLRIVRAIIDEAIAQRQAILSEDVFNDPRFTGRATTDATIRSLLCAPLCLGDRVLGALYLDSERPFDEGSLRFLAGVATVVGTAVENARLFARIQNETARRAVLERYFSPDLVDRVLRGEVPLARDGEVRNGTILFTDIRGFTAMTSATEPRVLVATLNAYFEAMQRIIFRARGTVERFGGDSILAYWSVMDRDPQGPRRASRAALHMQNEIFRLNRDLQTAGKLPLEIGIGVNTGDVIAGDVGSAERYEFTILGEAVNLARRIEDLAGPGEILIGETTREFLGSDALVRLLPPRTVKGRPKPLVLGALLGLKAEEVGRARARWDVALGGRLLAEGLEGMDVRLVGLELGLDGSVRLEVAAPQEVSVDKPVLLNVRMPTGSRAREIRGGTADLARPLEVTGKIVEGGAIQETASPLALQRAMAAGQSGVELLLVRVDDAGPLLSAIGLSP